MSCLTDREVADFIRGGGPALMERVDAHVDSCASCRALLGAAAVAAAATAAGSPGAGSDPHELVAGTQIGRYLVEGPLGRGGAGEVFAARDTQLDRPVALKLLHPAPGLAREDPAAVERLRREARALARVSHPNVVAVYEVGNVGDRLFIAMELVAGQTLRAWLDAEPRCWREIVALFAAAGRGLHAAHEHGFVHRDFKPANVLVDDHGRPKVVDFGLVRSGDDADGAADPGAEARAEVADLTLTGTVLGTPRYMSPEQHKGERAGPRADQYSFCVALYEALFGAPPFAGETFAELRAEVLRGDVTWPARAGGVPTAIVRALRRGLATRPEYRYPSMRALLTVLERALSRRRRARLAALVAGGVALATAGGVWLGLAQAPTPADTAALAAPTDPCADMERHFAAIWSEERRDRFEEGLERTWPAEPGPGVKPQLAERWEALGRVKAKLAAARVDRFGEAWTAQRREACQATFVAGKQSTRQLDLRLLCLERWRLEADRIIQSGVDAERSAAWARTSTDELAQRLGDCEAEVVSALPSLPVADKARWEAVQRGIAESEGLAERGDITAAIAKARETTAAARALGYGPALAEALAQQAGVVAAGPDGDPAAAPVLFEAYTTAMAARHDGLAGDVASRLGWNALRQRHNDKADEWAAIAKASYDRVGRGPGFYVWLVSIHGFAAHERGELKRGLALAEQALADARAASFSDIDVATLMGTVGLMRSSVGDRAGALRGLDDALRLAQSTGAQPTIDLIHKHIAQVKRKVARDR